MPQTGALHHDRRLEPPQNSGWPPIRGLLELAEGPQLSALLPKALPGRLSLNLAKRRKYNSINAKGLVAEWQTRRS
jgi:hypothetical protein